MHPAIISAAIVLATSSMMTGYVALRRDKADFHRLLLALLMAIMVWAIGTLMRFSVTSVEGLESSLQVVFLGIFAAPPLWLLLAANYARIPGLGDGGRVRLAILTPSIVAYVGLISNGAHGVMLREVSFEAMEAGGLAWGGPAFWVFIAWAYLCVFAGALLYMISARRLMVGAQRDRGLLLAFASLFPVAGSSIYLFQVFPVAFDLTPSTLTISLLLISVAVFRYQLLDALPLARRDVIEHLRDAVLMSAPDGAILDFNPAAARLLRCGSADLYGAPLGDMLSSLIDTEEGIALRAELEQRGDDAPPLLKELSTPEHDSLELMVASVRDAEGAPAGQYALVRDRTEERRFERLVRRIQKLETVGTLASGIAHEVNNPLAFIRANLTQVEQMGQLVEAWTERMQGSDDDETRKLCEELTDLRQIADEALDGIDRIERIVNGMRRLSASGDQGFEAVDPGRLLSDALRLSNLSRDPAVTVRTGSLEGLPEVDGNPERLVQALLNLLVNARQALGEAGGELRLEAEVANGHVELRVADDGPGIPREIQERIFDPFYTTKDPDQGTGLGLAIAFDIVRDHGGVLEVQSRPGQGACFTARLPVARSR